jgi:RNA polymerase sigma-70 factor (ECF subfamily)
MLHALLPREGEVAGLLALLLVHEARRATRTDEHGGFVKLADQDRSRWNAALIEHADALIVETLRRTAPGRFTLQAAIAALHAQAPTYAQTDWPQILTLYDELLRVWPSPVVALNRAVALAMVDGPEPALHAVEGLTGLERYRYFHSTRADLLHRLGRDAEAVAAYEAALALTGNAAEQAFLESAIAAVSPLD